MSFAVMNRQFWKNQNIPIRLVEAFYLLEIENKQLWGIFTQQG